MRGRKVEVLSMLKKEIMGRLKAVPRLVDSSHCATSCSGRTSLKGHVLAGYLKTDLFTFNYRTGAIRLRLTVRLTVRSCW